MKIEIPINCPECNSPVKRVNDQIYCTGENCPAQSAKKIEHFAKTLKIKGLGPATIDKLDISAPNELFDLDDDYILEKLGSRLLTDKLIAELELATQRPLEDILPAMGIPLVGKSASEKLKQVAKSLQDIDEQVCKLAGLGEKTASNLINWINSQEWALYPFSFRFTERNSNKEVSDSKGIIVITGKLTSYKTKSEATTVLSNLGFIVKDSITKDTKFLVNESGKESAKTIKARNTGITIIENLNEFIGEYI